MWYQLKSYLLFLLKSKNQHGIHSPFVYDLITKCFYDATYHSEFDQIKKIRKQLIQNNNSIVVNDFGAGSRVFKSNKRKIAAIAKNAGITPKRQQLLYRLVRYFKPENILELGTSLGLGSSTMAIANPAAKITTVEGCQNTSKIAQKLFDEYSLKNIQLHTSTFEDFFDKNTYEEYDLVYIDGNHNKEKTLQYFELLLTRINSNSILIFDDIHWSASMNNAWQKICKHPNVIVSIDTYFWGMVFFRTEQEKQHFTIRL